MKHRGKIFFINENLVKGWAFNSADQINSAKVNLYINDIYIKSTIANINIEKLKISNLHKTGNCGFHFDLEEHQIQNCDKVAVKIIFNQKEFKIPNIENYYVSKEFEFDNSILEKVANKKETSILIMGFQKSGTTGLTYKLANSLHNAEIKFEPKKRLGFVDVKMHQDWLDIDKNLVCKCLFYTPYKNHIQHIIKLYNKSVWILRDPRDQIISSILYRWYWTHKTDRTNFKPLIKLLKKKESDPSSVNFIDIIDVAINLEEFKAAKIKDYEIIYDLYSHFKESKSVHVLLYRDFINENFGALEQYLGFKIKNEVIENATLKRVKRSATSGNWKNWFTEKDVAFFKPIFSDYLDKLGFENDWKTNENQFIDKKLASEYVLKLSKKPTRISKFLKRLKQ